MYTEVFSPEIKNGSLKVRKRGGTEQPFSLDKVAKAVWSAFESIGLDPNKLDSVVENIASMVKAKCILALKGAPAIPVETVQDFVETTLMETGNGDVAKAYILYRSKREGIRDSRLEPDPTAISDYIHPGKYSRFMEEEKRREVYKETVARVESMHIETYPHLAEDIREAFDFVRDKKVLPSMRSMQFAGEAIKKINARQFNCLGEETEFITTEGVKTFKDFNHGDQVYVLTHKGNWKPAVVKSYGRQVLYKYTFARGRTKVDVRATGNHRWYLSSGEVQQGLSLGDKLHPAPSIISKWVYEEAEVDQRFYWAMGYVYGDGTLVKDKDGNYARSMVRLCNDDGKFLPRFKELGFSWSKPKSCNGDAIAYTGKYLKTLPNVEEDGFENIVAFIRGYLDADGSKNKNYTKDGISEFRGIQASGEESVEFIRSMFPVVGAYITSERDLTGQLTNFGERLYTSNFNLTLGFGNHGNSFYSVKSIEESTEEEVWCLEVEDDHSFVLPSGIVTGNCCYMLIDKLRAFKDTMYLLLCGCGVGYSVQYEHVEKLPALGYVDYDNVRHYTIQDSIEGWADALHALLTSYVKGYYIEFNYSKIRNKNEPLKTSGGKAPGHLQLKKALENIRTLLDSAQGRQLRPIECYDTICFAADAVLSGGIRRSATIALFSIEDGEMMAAKTGKWFDTHPWRRNSNNSAVLKRGEVNKRQFKRVFKCIKEFGEPGFVFVENYDHGFNPCVEINLNPVLEITEEIMQRIECKRAEGQFIPKVKIGDTFTGVAFCNLTEINAAAFKSPEDMFEAARMASRIGTLQAAYTSFPYLGWVSELIAEREALLGVSMTGMKDRPDISLNPEYQKRAAEIVVEENVLFASKLGISPASRTTCVKPAGTTSLELGCVGSGIHDHHARRYIRRVTANENQPVFQYFRSVNPHMCVKKGDNDWVIEFPIKAPEGATVKGDLSAIEFLELVKLTQENWVRSGLADPDRSPGACHNVSNTVTVRENEWDEVAEYVWANQNYFSGISFIPDTADKLYAFAPHEKIETEADEEKWNNLLRNYSPVDYSKMYEEEDNTDLTGEAACVGGACAVV